MRKILGLTFAVGLMASAASATLLLSVDTATNTVGGSTFVVEATELGGGFPNTGGRWESVITTNTDIIATVPANPPKTDFYCQWNGLSAAGLVATNYRYAEIHYSLSHDWIGTVQKCRLGDTITVTGSAGAADNFSNPELLNASGYTAGSHKFVVDLGADVLYAGNWKYLRWNMFNASTNDAGKSVTLDKIIFGTEVGDFSDVYYVAAIPTDWTVGASWNDGQPAHSDALYYVTNGVALLTPSTTATFPGDALSLLGAQRLELLAPGTDVITIDPLTLDGAEVAAGAGAAGEARIDGTISVVTDSRFSGATNDTRDVRILSQVSGGATIELSAPSHTVYIDNTNNLYSGTWVVSGGTTEFAAGSAVGSADIEVQSNGTLRIIGDWDGKVGGSTLTVADSPNAQVELGANAWTAGAAVFGGVNVSNGTYTAAELNALGSNSVFTGSGTLEVGFEPKTYYLQADIAANKWVGEKEWWYDAPSGGNQMPAAAPFAGSTFDVNGYAWRSKNQASAARFDGLLLVNDTVGSGLYVAYGGDFRLEGGMILSNNVTARPHKEPIGTFISDLQMSSAGKLTCRTLINGGVTTKVHNVSMDTISGPGEIQFGGNQSYDHLGVWSLAVTETCTNFTGTIDLQDGELTFANKVTLPNAAFTIASGESNTIILSNNVVFGSLLFEGSPLLTTGLYTADDLNTLFSTTRFSGDGTVGFEVVDLPLVAPVITDITVSGADLVISGTSSNINANGEYRLQSAGDLLSPGWGSVSTNEFDENGDFSVTIPIPGAMEEFYRLEVN